ncbi:DUF4367 domain-containing protein [Bacillus sp. JJ664]
MASSIHLLIVLFLFISSPTIIMAKEIKYNHNSITVPEIKKKINFTVLTPKKIPSDWTLEIKTYPWGVTENITNFRLHYMDSQDTILIVGIDQRKENPLNEELLSPNAKQVNINGNKGYFAEWGNSGTLDNHGELINGGLLFWAQDGTYLTMNSSRLSKEKMLEIARSMK